MAEELAALAGLLGPSDEEPLAPADEEPLAPPAPESLPQRWRAPRATALLSTAALAICVCAILRTRSTA